MIRWLLVFGLLTSPAYADMGVRRRPMYASAPVCGDGVKNGSDQCDGSDFGASTCSDYACTGGSLTCTGACLITTGSCTGCTPIAHVQSALTTNGTCTGSGTPSSCCTGSGTGTCGDSTTATTIARSFGSNVTAASAIVAAFTAGGDVCRDSGHIKAIVTDSRGNTYSAPATAWAYDGGHNQCAGVQYALNSGAGADTVTVTFYDNSACLGAGNPNGCCTALNDGTCTIAIGYRGLGIAEYSAVKTSAAIDASAAITGTTQAWSSGAVTTTVAGDLAFGVVAKDSGGATSSTPSGSYIERLDDTAGTGLVLEDQIQSVAGSISADGSFDTGNSVWSWISIILTLKKQ